MLIEPFLDVVLTHGDLGHIALLLWALSASGASFLMFKELKAANRRFDLFVRELHAFNLFILGDDE